MAGYDDTTNTDASFRLSTPPRDLVWGVLASLVILALAGAFFGFQNVRTGDIMPTGWVPGSGPAAGVASAAPAVAIPKDDKRSTLNGPQVLEPEAPFGESNGYVALEAYNMPMQVTAITHRRNPVFASIISQLRRSSAGI